MPIISKIARKFTWCCHRVQRCVVAPYSRGKLCSGVWKHGQDSQMGMFSLWHTKTISHPERQTMGYSLSVSLGKSIVLSWHFTALFRVKSHILNIPQKDDVGAAHKEIATFNLLQQDERIRFVYSSGGSSLTEFPLGHGNLPHCCFITQLLLIGGIL